MSGANGNGTGRTRRADHEARRNGGLVLITGGAGFVGANLADCLLREGRRVRILDNLSRAGVEQNLAWLRERHGEREDDRHGDRHTGRHTGRHGAKGGRLEVHVADVRDAAAVREAVAGCTHVFHLAAQVAVTTSLVDPVEDFEVNARGTLNVLEAARAQRTPPGVVFTSTNKVYGGLGDVPLAREGRRYLPVDAELRARGIGEGRPLDFHSPYGCSKGAADQYVLDHARSFGLPTVVFRMSCIYGPHQFGTEDQGWVAHFLIRALEGEPVTLYGDGMQVRDILFVDDLVDAFLRAERSVHDLAGQAFNVGGGARNTVSLLELLDLIGELHGRQPRVDFEGWRTGDQRYYVSDTRRLEAATGWRPRVSVAEGVERLYRWLREARGHAAQDAHAAREGGDDGARAPLAATAAQSPTFGGARPEVR